MNEYFIPLADQIEKKLTELELLIREAIEECGRYDLPDDWQDACAVADEAAQEMNLAIGMASDFHEHEKIVLAMLRRIDEFDAAEGEKP
jgi:hypothetical protein